MFINCRPPGPFILVNNFQSTTRAICPGPWGLALQAWPKENWIINAVVWHVNMIMFIFVAARIDLLLLVLKIKPRHNLPFKFQLAPPRLKPLCRHFYTLCPAFGICQPNQRAPSLSFPLWIGCKKNIGSVLFSDDDVCERQPVQLLTLTIYNWEKN